jgi:uroporphyrinogen III methyltransferase/synthase
MSEPGKVCLVGAGPGDPGLITVAGLQRLKEADIIVYDRLISEVLLKEAGVEAELIFVGKVAGDSHDQDAINRLLIEKALEGKRVVRLKGGDPFVFGRGGEEAEALRAVGIHFEVVPGVTSAVAVPAYAGIPVTHRGLASTFAVITGHEDPEKPESSIDWPKLATAVDTLVFLMGTKTLPDIVDKLVANGRSPDTPAAVIRWGTTPEQRTVVGTLADIVSRVEEAGITPPAITIVGKVVRLRKKLSWFEDRPLFGKRVLITRTRRQASVLSRLLAEEGAIPIELPAIEIKPEHDEDKVDAAMETLRAGEYAWTVFTSANAVEVWFGLVQENGYDARIFGHTNVAAIGPATAKSLAQYGILADLVPDEFVAESLVESLGARLKTGKRPIAMLPGSEVEDTDALAAFVDALHRESLQGDRERRTADGRASGPMRILIPRAESARPELVEGLRSAGAEVDEVTLYRAAVPSVAEGPSPQQHALSLLRDGAIDIITFTSSSTVRNLAAMFNGDLPVILSDEARPVILSDDHARARNDIVSRRNPGGEAASARRGRPLVACIGPITAKTAEELGLPVDIVASEYTVEGLVRAIRDRADAPR